MFTGSSQIFHFMDANLKKNLRQFTVVYGIVITALLALAFIPKYSGRITSYNVCYTKLLRG